MSIATLKRLTQHKYGVASAGRPQFSLTGTRRSAGWVGQTSLSRSLARTPMRGAVARGTSSCCGRYRVAENVVSGLSDGNDASVVKRSVLGARGTAVAARGWGRLSGECIVYKSSDGGAGAGGAPANTQGDHVKALLVRTAAAATVCEAQYIVSGIYVKPMATRVSCSGARGFRNSNYRVPRYVKDGCMVHQPEASIVAMTATARTAALVAACADASGGWFASASTRAPMACGGAI